MIPLVKILDWPGHDCDVARGRLLDLRLAVQTGSGCFIGRDEVSMARHAAQGVPACADVRFWDRYWRQSGHALMHCICLLLTQSGHQPLQLGQHEGYDVVF